MRQIVTAAIAAGALAGAAGAAVQADESTPPAPPVKADAVPISTREPGRLPDGRYSPDYVYYRVHPGRIAVRLPDPAGGPEWAVKAFDAERITIKRPARTLADGRVIGRSHCVQLGRLQDGVFGWVYGDGRFRRAGIEDQLLQCTGRKQPEPQARMASVLAIRDPADPAITGSVVWGLTTGGGAAVVAGTGAADGQAATNDGAFLRLGGADAHPRDDARVQLGGRTIRLGAAGRQLPPHLARRFHWPTLVPGSERVEARAPDPAGGPGYGVSVAQTREGVPCTGGPTRVVADRAGGVDLRLALFTESELSSQACRPLETKPTPRRACDIGTGFGNAEELEGNDTFLRRARTQRRLLAGRTTVYGQCSADVERVTVRTPRDVRTLVPSPVGHAFLAVYDGDFPAGELAITAQLRSGKTWTERHPLGF